MLVVEQNGAFRKRFRVLRIIVFVQYWKKKVTSRTVLTSFF